MDNSYLNFIVWRCPLCFSKINFTTSSPILGITLSEFDFALRLWIKTSASGSAAALLSRTVQTADYFIFFRNALAHYYKSRVKPYLKLGGNGIVEIDETKASNV